MTQVGTLGSSEVIWYGDSELIRVHKAEKCHINIICIKRIHSRKTTSASFLVSTASEGYYSHVTYRFCLLQITNVLISTSDSWGKY